MFPGSDETKTWVKICGITSPSEAEMVVAAGADAIGVIFAESKRRVEPSEARKIAAVARPVPCIGVFKGMEVAEIRMVVAEAGLDSIQYYGTDAGFWELLDSIPLVLGIRALTRAQALGGWAGLGGRHRGPVSVAVTVDGEVPGSGKANDPTTLSDLRVGAPLILAGGLTPENVGRSIELLRPHGVDVASGVERASGGKDPVLVRAFVEAVRRADERRQRSKPAGGSVSGIR